jgi:hypothetical protein
MLLVREAPPLRLGLEITGLGGGAFRWGLDDHDASDVPNDLSFSTTMPGGFDQASCRLARRPSYDYPDLQEFETVTIRGVGGDIAWQGRLESVPRSSGQQMSITPGMVGWQAHLDDDKSARMIYVDIALANWGAISVQRKLALLGGLPAWDPEDASVQPDPTTGNPSVVTHLTGPWSRPRTSEAWYDTRGLPIGSVYYAWNKGSTVDATDTAWGWYVVLCSNDLTAGDTTANLRGAGPGTGTVTASTSTRQFAAVLQQDSWNVGGGSDGVDYFINWSCLAVYGRHGLTKRGSGGANTAPGLYASDIIGHAVSTWAPKLATSRAGVSTITGTSFAIPSCVFVDPTTVSAIITEACRYDLHDWWVDEGAGSGPTFNLATRAGHGRDWIARVGPAGLSETGPQASQISNSVIVRFRDVVGATRSVGPPGSGADTTNASLADTDPDNLATVAGLTRRAVLDMGIVSTPAGALKIGQAFLTEQALLSTAGQASIVGHVQDASGTAFPAWMIRGGDRISFVDAHDTTSRRVVKTNYSDATKTNQIDLDAPPQGLDALLARLGAVLTPLGL